jgi:hypothetical protein
MRWMTVREFLRGGYQDLDDVTVVTKGGYPYFTVRPGLKLSTDESVRDKEKVLRSPEMKTPKSE